MQVRYQNTAADLAELPRLLSFWQRVLLRSGPLFPIAMSCLPSTLLLAAFGYQSVLAPGWGLAGLLAVYVLVKARQLTGPPNPKTLLPVTITIGKDGLRSENELGWARRHWWLIRRIVAISDYIALEIAQNQFFLIPRRAFASTDEADRFLAQALDFKQQAEEHPGKQIEATQDCEDLEAPALPSDDSIQLRYLNSVEDFAEVAFIGLKKQTQPAATSTSFWFWTVVATGGAILVVVFRNSEPPMRLLVGLPAFVIITLATLGFVTAATRFIWTRTFDRKQLRTQLVTMSARGVASEDELCQAFNSWAAIDGIEDDERFIVMYSAKPQIMHLIPKSAFASSDAARRFVEIAKHHHQTATASQDETLTWPDSQLVETGNPYQPPQT